MGRWGDGEMGRWGDGEMGRWGDGELGLVAAIEVVLEGERRGWVRATAEWGLGGFWGSADVDAADGDGNGRRESRGRPVCLP